jgi:integrase
MPMTFVALENAKPRDRPYKLSDGDGLHLLIKPNGSKLWRFRYQFMGLEKMISFGEFSEVSLADAREKRLEARKLLSQGTDPSQKKKEDKITSAVAAQNTFGLVAEEVIQILKESGKSEATLSKQRWLLLDLAAPLVPRPVSQITPAEVLVILQRIEARGLKETARRLRSSVSRVFRRAVATLRATNDPTYALRGALTPPVVTHRAALTEEHEVGALLVSIDEYTGWPTVRSALLFLSLTMVRPGEVRFMRRNEVNWPKAMWSIPGARMKMREPHQVPLSRQALAVLREVWPLTEGDRLVFPSIRSAVKPLSENAMNSALRRMGYTKDEMCSHGFRTAASTILNGRGFDPDVIEAALAHQDKDPTRAAYNRQKYLPHRVKLMQDWADLLDELRRLPKLTARA